PFCHPSVNKRCERTRGLSVVLIGQKSCDSNETGKLRLSLDSRQTHAGMTADVGCDANDTNQGVR
ncbi:MAG: hypothetical protein WBO07_09085, partial [Formosimonas sp.]